MAFVFRGEKIQNNKSNTAVAPGNYHLKKDLIIYKFIIKTKYQKHMFLLTAWNQNFDKIITPPPH